MDQTKSPPTWAPRKISFYSFDIQLAIATESALFAGEKTAPVKCGFSMKF